MLDDVLRAGTIFTVLTLSLVLTVHCGGDESAGSSDSVGAGASPGGSGGASVVTGGGGGTETGGTAGSGAGGGASGAASICDMFPEGHANRITFGVQDTNNIQVPAQNTENKRMFLRKIENLFGKDYATFGVYDSDSPTTAPSYTGIANGESRTSLISPNVGEVSLQVCTMTSNPCSVGTPASTPMGDANCTANVAADRPWGPR